MRRSPGSFSEKVQQRAGATRSCHIRSADARPVPDRSTGAPAGVDGTCLQPFPHVIVEPPPFQGQTRREPAAAGGAHSTGRALTAAIRRSLSATVNPRGGLVFLLVEHSAHLDSVRTPVDLERDRTASLDKRYSLPASAQIDMYRIREACGSNQSAAWRRNLNRPTHC
jgi:hypothetical protein